MASEAAILDMSDPHIKRMVLAHIKNSQGLHKFVFKKARPNRSLNANAFLWGCVYKAIQEGLYEAWGERLSVEEVHLMMKEKFMTQPIINRKTGEHLGNKICSTASLDTARFGEYIEKCIKFAGELGVTVPQPSTV